MNLQAEPPTLKKIFNAGDSCVLLFSGNVADGEEVVNNVLAKLTGKQNLQVAQIAECTKASYLELKRKRVEENILGPLLGASFAQFQALVGQSPSSQILQQVLGLIMQHNLQLDVLVAGTDASGGHLFVATHPGQLLSVNMIGFAAIGSGALHAAVRLSLGQHTAASALQEAVFNVHEAKKSSEVAPGVGKLTDVAIVRNGKTFALKPDLLAILEEVHKEKPALSAAEWGRIKKACDESTA
jgi:20S proteasome alpha/beta subunit